MVMPHNVGEQLPYLKPQSLGVPCPSLCSTPLGWRLGEQGESRLCLCDTPGPDHYLEQQMVPTLCVCPEP